ncbi:MAG: hypothetical protein AVO34_13935 [Firmicutes bacterium ML8_F2]|jgi:hypothetical protein|nr:MAG: hypothetical protein AVO34_13935 [Firmicutes bacterium ML8_F2]
MTLKRQFLWIIGLAIITITVLWLGLDEITASIKQVNPGLSVFLLTLQVLTLLALALQWQSFLLKQIRSFLFYLFLQLPLQAIMSKA